MDNATKRKLKQPDQFIALTGEGVEWAGEHRQTVIVWGIVIVVAILALVGGITLYQQRANAADTAFGEAMQVYQTPLVNSGQEVPPGMKTFPDSKTRAAAANEKFVAIAHQYGLLHTGKLAEYFAGLTYAEEGQNGNAEEALQSVAGSWDKGLSALAKMSLAQLDQQTGKDSDAIALYQELAKTDASTVPAGMAQLQLADLYESEGKTDEARKIYAELKDKSKDAQGKPTAIAELASEKLNPHSNSSAQ